jgi:hypothetical protein
VANTDLGIFSVADVPPLKVHFLLLKGYRALKHLGVVDCSRFSESVFLFKVEKKIEVIS